MSLYHSQPFSFNPRGRATDVKCRSFLASSQLFTDTNPGAFNNSWTSCTNFACLYIYRALSLSLAAQQGLKYGMLVFHVFIVCCLLFSTQPPMRCDGYHVITAHQGRRSTYAVCAHDLCNKLQLARRAFSSCSVRAQCAQAYLNQSIEWYCSSSRTRSNKQ